MKLNSSLLQKVQDFIKQNIKLPSNPNLQGVLNDDSEVVHRNLLILLTLVIVSITVIYTTIYYPYKTEINALEKKYKKMVVIRDEIAQINVRLGIETILLEEKRRKYEKLTRIFHSESELEELYESISKLAIRYGLKVTGFSRKKPEAIYEVILQKKQKEKIKEKIAIDK